MSCHLEQHLKRELITVLCELSKAHGYYNFRVQFLISFSPVPQSKCTWGFFEAVSVHILLSLSDGINLLDTQQG